MVMTIEQHDLSVDYLLGRFDSRRMLRLEGMPAVFRHTFQTTYIEAKRLMPDLWKNVTYVAPALNYPEKLHADWTPELLMINAERLGSRQALAHTREAAVNSDRRIVADSPRPLESFISLLAWHEHGHGLLSELELSDAHLGTTYVAEFGDLVARHIAGYDPWGHVQALGLPYSDELTRLAPSDHSRHNRHELFADLLAHHHLGDPSPIVSDAGRWITNTCGAEALNRTERQHALLKRNAVAAVQRWQNIALDYLNLGAAARAVRQVRPESDLRFLASCDLSDAHFVGSQQVAMAHRQKNACLNSAEAQASKSLATNLGLTSGWS